MRTATAFLVGLALCATTAACGDKGGGGDKPAAGTPPATANTPAAMADAPAMATAPTAPAGDPSSAAGTWNADMSGVKAMMAPMLEMAKSMLAMAPPEGKAEAEKQLKEVQAKFAAFDKAKIVLTLKKDGTATMDMNMPGEEAEAGAGTWTQTGNKVTIKQTMKNGKPYEDDDPQTLTLEGNKLTPGDGAKMPITFTR